MFDEPAIAAGTSAKRVYNQPERQFVNARGSPLLFQQLNRSLPMQSAAAGQAFSSQGRSSFCAMGRVYRGEMRSKLISKREKANMKRIGTLTRRRSSSRFAAAHQAGVSAQSTPADPTSDPAADRSAKAEIRPGANDQAKQLDQSAANEDRLAPDRSFMGPRDPRRRLRSRSVRRQIRCGRRLSSCSRTAQERRAAD